MKETLNKPPDEFIAVNQLKKSDECQLQMEEVQVEQINITSSTMKSKLYDCLVEVTSLCLTVPLLSLLTVNALVYTFKRQRQQSDLDPSFTPNEDDDLEMKYSIYEDITQDETYYAKRWGYDCQQYEIITKDGYVLKMYRFSSPKISSESKKPVLIGHGLFQCSGAFVLNEKKSLAFALVDQGYDVWTGNNRAVASLDHTYLSPNDVNYWNWGLKELGLHDLPTMLDYIRSTTGFETVAYIGHSQGNAQAFVALNLQPELANKMSCFIALAPAVIAGPLISSFPLRALIQLDPQTFRIIFGHKSFLGIMTTAQKYLPPKVLSCVAYSVFAYLFEWWDKHWIKRRKVKYFQYTPRLASSQLLLDWIEGWGKKGLCKYVEIESQYLLSSESPSSPSSSRSYHTRKAPLTLIYGTKDYLVDGAAFVRTFKGYEQHGIILDEDSESINMNDDENDDENTPMYIKQHECSFPTLDLVHVERIENYEHMDTIFAADNYITTYPIIFKTLNNGLWE
ncbi:unnamed protein product [Cunninghamella blakesleeana]